MAWLGWLSRDTKEKKEAQAFLFRFLNQNSCRQSQAAADKEKTRRRPH